MWYDFEFKTNFYFKRFFLFHPRIWDLNICHGDLYHSPENPGRVDTTRLSSSHQLNCMHHCSPWFNAKRNISLQLIPKAIPSSLTSYGNHKWAHPALLSICPAMLWALIQYKQSHKCLAEICPLQERRNRTHIVHLGIQISVVLSFHMEGTQLA